MKLPPHDVALAALASFAFVTSMLALGVALAHGDAAGITVFCLGGVYSGRHLRSALL